MATTPQALTTTPDPPPPFKDDKEAISTTDLIIPAAYRISGPPREFHIIDNSTPNGHQEWLEHDLNVARLNKIHEHLWMAGLPQIPRALHDHLRIGRSIDLTEQADLHLVWSRNSLFLKPLPDYLLNYVFWKTHLCPHRDIFQDAQGFLLSYLWLITSKADWKLATQLGLLNESVTWNQWAAYSRSALSHIDETTLVDVNPRYLYGELRLDRLGLIYRFCSTTRSFSVFMRGYYYGYHNYSTFVERNFAWVLTAIIYITIVLTAMQLGLATDRLVDDAGFQRAAFGFTVFSIIAPLAILTRVAVILLVTVCLNWRFAKKQRQLVNLKYPHLKQHPKAQHVKIKDKVKSSRAVTSTAGVNRKSNVKPPSSPSASV